MSAVAVVTIAHRRHEHWRLQRHALARSRRQPDLRVLVAIDDAYLAAAGRASGALVIELDRPDGALCLARARNAGAEAAVTAGAGVLVFLDVDCLPGRELLGAYADAAGAEATRDHLLSGPVTYLDP